MKWNWLRPALLVTWLVLLSGCTSKLSQNDIQTALERQGLTVSYTEIKEIHNGDFEINGKAHLGVGYYNNASQREQGKQRGEAYVRTSGAHIKYFEAKNILFAYQSSGDNDVTLERKVLRAIEELQK